MVSGNRWDPLDFGTNLPSNTRLTVVFDRQDSRAWSLDTSAGPDNGINADSQLLNAGKWAVSGSTSLTLSNASTIAFGDARLTPGGSYYLTSSGSGSSTPDFGYYVTFPDRFQDATNNSIYHYSKGITAPMVVSGSVYYSFFTPTTADICSGGAGYTFTQEICDGMNPVVYDTRTGLICTSQNVDAWGNVASNFAMLGTIGVQQAGTRKTTDANGNTIMVMDIATYTGLGQSRYPKARVWRTVH
jgi:hypothetical protein